MTKGTSRSNDLCEIRRAFLNYFEKEEHRAVRSSHWSLKTIPPALHHAGMVQFKGSFLAEETRDYSASRVFTEVRSCRGSITTWKCGKTARHHTFFEMLGNFPSGTIFKKEAIEFGDDLLCPPTGDCVRRRYVITIYLEDDEAFPLLEEDLAFHRANRRMGEKDN